MCFEKDWGNELFSIYKLLSESLSHKVRKLRRYKNKYQNLK